jgi:hypothetical protein
MCKYCKDVPFCEVTKNGAMRTFICPTYGTDTFERDRDYVLKEVLRYVNENGLPIPRPYAVAMKEYNLMSECILRGVAPAK